jgi:hypothetical protein
MEMKRSDGGVAISKSDYSLSQYHQMAGLLEIFCTEREEIVGYPQVTKHKIHEECHLLGCYAVWLL